MGCKALSFRTVFGEKKRPGIKKLYLSELYLEKRKKKIWKQKFYQ